VSSVVEIRDLFRVYPSAEGGVAALQGLTLSIERGELCVVLGPSGSGKSTLVRIVAAFDRPSAGSATVAGTNVATLGSWAAGRFRSRSIGYADQHYWRALAGELTARELVGVQLGLAGASRAERERRAEELLERVGLGERAHAHPRELSGGEQQRVALCAAVARRPDLLIADEPTGELDAATAREVLDLIAELVRREGSTALVVSHDPASAARADRLVHVRDGRVSDERLIGGGDGAIVVGRGGWLRLPEDLLRAAGIERRAAARLEAGRLVVSAPEAASVSQSQASPVPPTQAVQSGRGAAGVSQTQGCIEARGLTRSFDGVTPIDGLTVAFAPGTLTVVTGPSGSGKTTLLHLLAGLDLPDAGEVLVGDVALSGLDRPGRAELRRTRIAFVGQAGGLVPFLGARENVELGLGLRGVDGDAQATLEAVGLAEHAERPVAELSAGQRVRAALARALAPKPLVLLADEPTARLDAANALALGTLLADLARDHGTTVICATHDPLLIEQAGAELSLRSS
jgi:ABC-type lipoprotein export system ATPase subunit